MNEIIDPEVDKGEIEGYQNSLHETQNLNETTETVGELNNPEYETNLVRNNISNPRSDDVALRHVEQVRNLSLQLFDGTKQLHELNDGCRNILAISANFLDARIPKGRKKSKIAARKLIEVRIEEDLNAEETSVLESIIVLQNKKVKRKHIAALDLDPIQQREALTLLALQNIAVGLDESYSQTTKIIQVESTRGELWIIVDGPEVLVDISAAQHNSWLWVTVGYPGIKFLAAREAQTELLPYPEPFDNPGLEADDALSEAGRKVLRYHFARMIDHEAGTRLGENIEELHKMRVATRRMRAAFVVFGETYETQSIKSYLKSLRKTARVLGRVRDLDVFIDKATKYIENLPDDQCKSLNPLLNDWYTQREEAREQMLVYLNSEAFQTFKRKFNVFLSNSGAGALPFPKDRPYPQRVNEIAPQLIYTRMSEVRAFEPFLVDASIETLHALRIEMKRLRYTIEFFSEVLGPESKPVLDVMKTMQDHLGDLNDAQVAAQSIQRFIDRWDIEQEDLPISERQNPEAIVSYLASRHAELHKLSVGFGKTWDLFNNPDFRKNLALAVSVL